MDIYNAISLLFSGLAIVVAGSAFILSVLTFRRDRSDLRVGVEYQHRSHMGRSFRAVLVNHGRRPVSVEDVKLHFKSGRVLSQDSLFGPLPAILQEGDSCSLYFPLYDQRGKLVEDPVRFSHVEAEDTLGRKYAFPTRTIRSQMGLLRLKRRIRSECAEV